MKIVIIGAGAMGSLFGGLLSNGNNDVWLLDVWKEHVQAINENGLRIDREGITRTVTVRATTDPADTGTADLIIIFVKSTQTRTAAETAATLANKTTLVMTLQNGMGNADTISRVMAPDRVIAGTTAHGATLLGPGHIRHAGQGATIMGMWNSPDNSRVQQVVDLFTGAGIKAEARDDIRQTIWEKLLVNVGINAITALTHIKNGQLLDLESTRALCRSAVEEAAQVATALGISIRSDVVEHVYNIASATSENRSSMGQDVDNCRLTEIGAINGAVVAEARKRGIPVPVNQTLTALVETLQAHYS
jgi:2-dehydropantoate 2-reductase